MRSFRGPAAYEREGRLGRGSDDRDRTFSEGREFLERLKKKKNLKIEDHNLLFILRSVSALSLVTQWPRGFSGAQSTRTAQHRLLLPASCRYKIEIQRKKNTSQLPPYLFGSRTATVKKKCMHYRVLKLYGIRAETCLMEIRILHTDGRARPGTNTVGASWLAKSRGKHKAH